MRIGNVQSGWIESQDSNQDECSIKSTNHGAAIRQAVPT